MDPTYLKKLFMNNRINPIVLIFFLICFIKDIKAYNLFGACDTTYKFFGSPFIPSGITWDGIHFWHNDSTRFIRKLNINGNIIGVIPNPSESFRGGGICWDGNSLWLVNEESSQLFKLDTLGNLLNTFILPSKNLPQPNGWGITFDGSYLWHSSYDPSILYKINPNNGLVADSFFLETKILGIMYTNSYLYAIGFPYASNFINAFIYKIDLVAKVIVDSMEWCVPRPLGITVKNDSIYSISGPIDWGGDNKIYCTPTPYLGENNDHSNVTINVYPNPTTNFINLDVNDSGTVEIFIYDAIGREIRHNFFNGNLVINTSDFNYQGVIYIKLYTKIGILNVKKVIIL